jgi:diguanylate cyclase (GGDEF)-like protein
MDEFSAIAQLTRQADFQSLCRTQLEAVRDMTGDADAALLEAFDASDGQAVPDQAPTYAVRQIIDGQEVATPDWLPAALGSQPASDAPAVIRLPDGGAVICLGRLAGLDRFLVLKRPVETRVLRGVRRISTIFVHLLTLMDHFERDPLTDLLNRQSFDYRFEQLLERSRRNPHRVRVDSSPWLAVADIDHFKRINDTFGHLQGDEILLQFASLLRESFRTEDLLFRYGGEEFVIILNNTDSAGAAHALERFRARVAAHYFPEVEHVTVSLGWVGFRPQALTSQLIQRADRALYQAKSLGRNRIVRYHESLDESRAPWAAAAPPEDAGQA